MPATQVSQVKAGFLTGIRVLEIADEHGEYCGKVLAGLGAEVIKIEPPTGEVTRSYGPFADSNSESLYFWHYNIGKRSVTLDLENDPADRQTYLEIAATADVILDAHGTCDLERLGLGYETVKEANESAIYARVTPFGEDGPWASYRGSDLVHLALGGVMANCGYDPTPDGKYDTPPIAPQMWQAYHITGETLVLSIIAALIYRLESGHGQKLSASVHDAVSKNTETDLPDWVYLRQEHLRLTCRHSMPQTSAPALAMTKDGRWLLPYRTYLPGFVDVWKGSLGLLKQFDMQVDLEDEQFQRPAVQGTAAGRMHMADAIDKLIGKFKYERNLWADAQKHGLPWAPIRRPEENAADPHWQMRGSFVEIDHAGDHKSYTHVGARWVCQQVPWNIGQVASIGQHNDLRLDRPRPPRPDRASAQFSASAPAPVSKRGTNFPLAGVRVLDLGWLLASAGAGRFFSALGAEVIKVEHKSRWDAMRWGTGMAPPGGRVQREAAHTPIPIPESENPNRGGAFMEINAGKLGASLNLKTAEGKELLAELIKKSDVIVEGFSPGTLERMGFGYDVLKTLNPSIIYVQQSGMGQAGTYGNLRSYGPTAQAFSGLSDMSGLPEPYPPAGIGYSYLDWFGAYNMATAMMAGLYRKAVTGEGCHIDASQVEIGIYLTGTAVLEHSVNGRRWSRFGNNSPYKPASPQGTFRTAGADRWIALSCFTDSQWISLAETLDIPQHISEQYADGAVRQMDENQLNDLIQLQTQSWEPYDLMNALQAKGVPAGVCQTVEDRCERDPQLQHLEWLVDLTQSDIGVWPVKEIPVRWSETPPYIGGRFDRSGPSYAEDNEYVYGAVLGLSPDQQEKYKKAGAF